MFHTTPTLCCDAPSLCSDARTLWWRRLATTTHGPVVVSAALGHSLGRLTVVDSGNCRSCLTPATFQFQGQSSRLSASSWVTRWPWRLDVLARGLRQTNLITWNLALEGLHLEWAVRTSSVPNLVSRSTHCSSWCQAGLLYPRTTVIGCWRCNCWWGCCCRSQCRCCWSTTTSFSTRWVAHRTGRQEGGQADHRHKQQHKQLAHSALSCSSVHNEKLIETAPNNVMISTDINDEMASVSGCE